MQADLAESKTPLVDNSNPVWNPLIADIISIEKYANIKGCNIMLNGNGEYFESDNKMSQLRNGRLSTLFKTAQEKTKEGYLYSVLCANADKRSIFFKLSEFQKLVSSSTYRSSKEAILPLVKVIRHSVKSVKNLMIKKRETGGMVVFNLWWDYTLCRIVNLSHDESVVR